MKKINQMLGREIDISRLGVGVADMLSPEFCKYWRTAWDGSSHESMYYEMLNASARAWNACASQMIAVFMQHTRSKT